ncbi:MAG: hypothetical protein AAGJ97_12590 [Planctomycetota bacterium]
MSTPDESAEDAAVRKAMLEASEDAIGRARRHGTKLISWHDGRVVELTPEEAEEEVRRAREGRTGKA